MICARTEVTFAVNEPTVNSGTISDTLVCKRSNEGTLVLVGNIGPVKHWESSVNDFRNTTTISNTTNSQTFGRLNEYTQYRAVIQNGACLEKNSGTATVSW